KGMPWQMPVCSGRFRLEFEEARPDLIVMFTTDHFISFFLDNMPTFCVGAFNKADRPHELARSMPFYHVTGGPDFAHGLVEYGLDKGFDLACSESMKLDHATLVPM